MYFSNVQFWLVPVVIALVWIIYVSGRLLMVPMRLFFRLSLLAIPVWVYFNWAAIQSLLR